MTIRTFRREDASEVARLWNTSLREDKANPRWYIEDNILTEDKLEKMISNPNFDCKGAFVAYDGQEMIGFGRGVVKKVKSYEDENLEDLPGYLEGLVVKPSFRRKGIGTQLLEHIEAYIEAEGKDAIWVSRYRSPVARISVLPETPEYRFLLKRGFREEGREMRLKLIFEDFVLRDEVIEARERLKHEGIEIRYYEDQYRGSFSELMERRFQGWWYRGYKPNLEGDEPLPVLVAVDKGRVVGFVGFVAVRENKRAGFSPGVDPEYRRRGIGTVLVNLWAKEVKEMGAEESLISTGVGNYPAQSIYFDMGYEKLGEFCDELVKDLRD